MVVVAGGWACGELEEGVGSWQLCRSYSRTRHSLCQEGWHAPQDLCRSWQASNLPRSWSGRDSDFHLWLWGSTPQWLPLSGERGGRVSSMPLCPEEAIHEGISHSGSGGCRSGDSLVDSGAPRGKQLAQGPLCYPRGPAPTSSATCSSSLAASSSCEGTGFFRASCRKAKGMWHQAEGAELHHSDLKEEQRSSSLYLEGRRGGRCEGQTGLGNDRTSCKDSQ